MMLKKLKANGAGTWCACCGRVAENGDELIRIEMSGTTRYVSKSHLVSWASLAGEGETLPLDKKPPRVLTLDHMPSTTSTLQLLTKQEHEEKHAL